MFDVTQAIAYSFALGIATASPGPTITALIVHSVTGGAIVGAATLLGSMLASLTYLSATVLGFAVVIQNFKIVFTLIEWAAILYLLYLAWVFWTSKPKEIATNKNIDKKDILSGFSSGFVINISNPKTATFYLALLPAVVNLEMITFQIWAFWLVPLTITVLLIIGMPYVIGSVSVRHFLLQPKGQKILSKVASIAMTLAAFFIIYRTSGYSPD